MSLKAWGRLFGVAGTVVGCLAVLSSATKLMGATSTTIEGSPGEPNFDARFGADGVVTERVRTGLLKAGSDPKRTAAVREDLDRIRLLAPDVVIDADPVLLTPRFVRSTSRFISAPRPGTDAGVIVREFIADHAGLFEIAPTDLKDAKVVRDYVTEHNGVRHLTYLQQFGGVDIFQAELRANVTKAGEIINLSSTMVPRPHAPNKPALSAAQAIIAAAASVGVEVLCELSPIGVAEGANELQRWVRTDDFRADRDVVTRRVYFPMSRTELRAAFYVIIPVRGIPHTHNIVIDAVTGETLFRDNELRFFDRIRAYPGRSPRPGPVGNQYPVSSRQLMEVTPNAASPFGWWDTNGVAGPEFMDTRGNNADAYLDIDADLISDVPRPTSPGLPLLFDAPMDNALNPPNWREAAVLNAFYLANIIHDRMYDLGFTPAAGNFQVNNYGQGGLGNDPIRVSVHDDFFFNNASFGTPADDSSPNCYLHIYTRTSPNRDPAVDADVFFHECGHGLSNRLTGGPADANALQLTQPRGLGEGWSDFVSECLQASAGEDPSGAFPTGAYVNDSAGGARLPLLHQHEHQSPHLDRMGRCRRVGGVPLHRRNLVRLSVGLPCGDDAGVRVRGQRHDAATCA